MSSCARACAEVKQENVAVISGGSGKMDRRINSIQDICMIRKLRTGALMSATQRSVNVGHGVSVDVHTHPVSPRRRSV